MSPRKVRRKYVRHLIVWIPLVAILGTLSLIFPWMGWVLLILIGAVVTLFLITFGIPCTFLAVSHFIRTGYWTNPMRHGPWGDWKGEF